MDRVGAFRNTRRATSESREGVRKMERNDTIDDAIDVGAVATETRGTAPVGIYDSEQQAYFLAGGIDDED